ncbi:MAG: cyclic nucleotide-binding domain-containing protein [Polyangiales bacterium]
MKASDDTIAKYLTQHPSFDGLEPAQVSLIASHAQLTQFAPGQALFSRDGEAREFFIVREGTVTVGVPSIEGESLEIQTVGPGSMLGWSWLIPPYRWSFDARAVTPTSVIAVNGEKLREVCEVDLKLGYELMKRFAFLMAKRLNAARMVAIRQYAAAY